MLVPDLGGFVLLFELGIINFLEDVLEAPVIDLQNGVLGREVAGNAAAKRVVERGAGKVADGLVKVVHAHGDARCRGVKHLVLDFGAVVADELHRQFAFAGEFEIGGAVLIAKCVTANDDRLGPSGNKARHVLADDRLAENDAAEDVADGAVGRTPHLLEAEFFNAAFIGGDGGAFHANAVLLDCVGRIDCHLIIGRIAVFNREVVIFEIDIEIGVDQFVLDRLPDDAGHLIAVEFDDWVGDFDLAHELLLGAQLNIRP